MESSFVDGSTRRRPWLVIVTGEPGSGKTSLGLALATALRVPFLSRDHVRGGLLATSGLWTNDLHALPSREAAVTTFVQIVEAIAGLGVSAVLEYIATPDRAEATERLLAAGSCLMVVTTCESAAARAERRDRADALVNREDVLAALGHRSIDDYVSDPQRAAVRAAMLTLDLPSLQVRTDDGYDPPLAEIIDWVVEQTRSDVRPEAVTE